MPRFVERKEAIATKTTALVFLFSLSLSFDEILRVTMKWLVLLWLLQQRGSCITCERDAASVLLQLQLATKEKRVYYFCYKARRRKHYPPPRDAFILSTTYIEFPNTSTINKKRVCKTRLSSSSSYFSSSSSVSAISKKIPLLPLLVVSILLYCCADVLEFTHPFWINQS